MLGVRHIFESRRLHLLGQVDQATDQSRAAHRRHAPPSGARRIVQLGRFGLAAARHRRAVERRLSLRPGCADEGPDI